MFNMTSRLTVKKIFPNGNYCDIKCDFFFCLNDITFLFTTFLKKKNKHFIISIYPRSFSNSSLRCWVWGLPRSSHWNTTSTRFLVKEQKSQPQVSFRTSSPFDFNWNERRSKGSQSRNSKSSALTIENVNIYPTLIPCQSLIIRAIYSANICVA